MSVWIQNIHMVIGHPHGVGFGRRCSCAARQCARSAVVLTRATKPQTWGLHRHFFHVFVFVFVVAVVFVIFFVFVFVSSYDYSIALIISFQNMYVYRGL